MRFRRRYGNRFSRFRGYKLGQGFAFGGGRIQIVGTHKQRSSLPRNCLRRTNADTFAAMDTFVVAHRLGIHLTNRNTHTAIGTLLLIHLHAQQRHFAKEAVNRAQGADESAEETEKYNAQYDECHQKQEFPREDDAEHSVITRVVGQQPKRAFKQPCGANVLTKRRNRASVHIHERQNHDHQAQNHVLEIGKQPCQPPFFHLRGRDFIQELLAQPDGTEEAANHPAKHDPENRQDPEDVRRPFMIGVGQRPLQRAKRTRANRPRAGIAVEPRQAHFLGCAIEQLSIYVAF